MKRIILVLAIVLSIEQTFCQTVILSGPEKGSYYSLVNDIVTIVGQKNGISLTNTPTGGSGYNFKKLSDPSSGYHIALIQSDYLNLTQAEDKLNNTNKTGSLKVVLQLAKEEIQIVAKKSSGIRRLQDLENKKVAVGNEEQGSFATGRIINERSKINWTPYFVGFDQMLKTISAGSVDAGLIVGSAPVNILDIDPQIMVDGISMIELDDYNGWAKYYENDTVYRKDYKWLDKDIPTFSVRTLLIVNDAKLTPEERKTVEAIKSGIIQNIDILKKQGHPKWKEFIIPDDPDSDSEKNTVKSKTPDQISGTGKDAVLYRVQIYSRNYQKQEEKIIINGKSYNSYIYSHLGAFRYTIGEFATLSEATELQNECRKSGYKEAFVAAFKNDIRTNDPVYFK
jgi:uncharacterized protein